MPNGPDDSWKVVANNYKDEKSVIWSPVDKAHANLARNHGMKLSQGKYIRFLDDDDYLYRESAIQLIELEKSKADMSQGAVDVSNTNGEISKTITPIYDENYNTAILNFNRITLPCSSIYKTKDVISNPWDEKRSISQDVAWAISLCETTSLSRKTHKTSVAAWVQHPGERISTNKNLFQHHKEWFFIILNTTSRLIANKAITREEKEAAIESLWLYAHHSFPMAPCYWSRRILEILAIDKNSRPQDYFYAKPAVRSIHPVLVEWAAYPVRISRHSVKEVTKFLHLN